MAKLVSDTQAVFIQDPTSVGIELALHINEWCETLDADGKGPFMLPSLMLIHEDSMSKAGMCCAIREWYNVGKVKVSAKALEVIAYCVNSSICNALSTVKAEYPFDWSHAKPHITGDVKAYTHHVVFAAEIGRMDTTYNAAPLEGVPGFLVCHIGNIHIYIFVCMLCLCL